MCMLMTAYVYAYNINGYSCYQTAKALGKKQTNVSEVEETMSYTHAHAHAHAHEDSDWGNWVSPTSSFQALNTSESLSFLNVANYFSSLISRMLQVLYFFTVSLHVSKA